jgi:type IV secretory pathway VirJ component
MKNNIYSVLLISTVFIFSGHTSTLPLKEWTAAGDKPFVFYISGDGGFNSFSTDVCDKIHAGGYAVTALNAKSYFWDKKTPEQTVTDITTYLQQQFINRTNQQFILVGYSFGADVMPFVVNRLPVTIKKNLVSTILLAPSTSTDFEIHWLDLMGSNKKRSMDVVAEVNKMQEQKLITIFGTDDDDFPVKDVHLKNYTNEILPGGHHFDGNTDEVVRVIKKHFL